MYLMLLMPHYLLVHTLILGTFAPATLVVFAIISFNRISSVMMYLSRGKWNMFVLFKSWRQNCCWRTALWSLSPLRISIGFYLKRPLSSTNSAFTTSIMRFVCFLRLCLEIERNHNKFYFSIRDDLFKLTSIPNI